MSPGRCELLFLDEAVSRLMKPETAYLIGLAPVACCSTVSNSYICSICSAVRASAVHEARRSSSEPQPPTYLAASASTRTAVLGIRTVFSKNIYIAVRSRSRTVIKDYQRYAVVRNKD